MLKQIKHVFRPNCGFIPPVKLPEACVARPMQLFCDYTVPAVTKGSAEKSFCKQLV